MKTITTLFLVFSFWGLFQRGYGVVFDVEEVESLRHRYCFSFGCISPEEDVILYHPRPVPSNSEGTRPVPDDTVREEEGAKRDSNLEKMPKIGDIYCYSFGCISSEEDVTLDHPRPVPGGPDYLPPRPVPGDTAREEEGAKRKIVKDIIDSTLERMPKISEGFKAVVCNPRSIETDTTQKDGYQYHPGCEALADPLTYSDDVVDKLYNSCLPSLKKAILKNSVTPIDKGNVINRNKLFANMLDEIKINPKEQRFLAMVFISFGETRGNKHGREDEGKRFKRVMKALDTKLKKMKKTSKNDSLTAMDIALDQKQFSSYNPRDPNWAQMINYQTPSGRSRSMKNAVKAFVQFEQK